MISELFFLEGIMLSCIRNYGLFIQLTEKVKVEVQFRTIAMDFWASTEHKLYYKYDKDVPKHLAEELFKADEMVHSLDNKMGALKREIDNFGEMKLN